MGATVSDLLSSSQSLAEPCSSNALVELDRGGCGRWAQRKVDHLTTHANACGCRKM